jgi:RAQPRD family integrative conjugative element protein
MLPRIVLPFFALALPASAAMADGDGERAALARLVGEIDQLAPLIREAESQSSPQDRVRFGYAWLREDIDKVREGINAHLHRPRTEPQAVAPLRGGYQ